MAITRVACPECRAGLKSQTGFTVGQTVCCPKCETYFTVEEPRGGPAEDDAVDQPRRKKRRDDESDWSYKNSWMRYAVLGVLLVVLGVLGYMLYEKKQREAKEARETSNADDERGGAPLNPNQYMQLPPPPIGLGGGGGGGGRPAPPPQQQLEGARKRLVGTWSSGADTIEYKDNGDFVFTTTADGEEKKLSGKWRLVSMNAQPNQTGDPLSMVVEWTPEGKPAMTDGVTLGGNRLTVHPVLEPDGSGKKPGKDFVKK